MKFESYTAGVYRQQYQYKDFLPTLVNREWTWNDPRINVLLEKATKSLGELNAFTRIVPDVDLFILMHVNLEAKASSRIEGTNTEMDEIVLPESEIMPERRDDWREVQNYIKAMNEAIKTLGHLPLSLRLLCQAHGTLMKSVRGEKKAPGEFRHSQNWIGGTGLVDAAFIPPHHNDVMDLLGDLESFWHNETIDVPHLIRIAISHYQFETIHPFLDGNGRIGRLLITFYLLANGVIDKPALYLSAYLDRYRNEYYDALTQVREANDIGHWVRFFLKAVDDTANTGRERFQRILDLRQELDKSVVTLGKRGENARNLIQHLYSAPAISVRDAMDVLDIQYGPANSLIDSLVGLDVLKEATGQTRNRIFLFQRYLDIF